jgi:hypothetical protein
MTNDAPTEAELKLIQRMRKQKLIGEMLTTLEKKRSDLSVQIHKLHEALIELTFER